MGYCRRGYSNRLQAVCRGIRALALGYNEKEASFMSSGAAPADDEQEDSSNNGKPANALQMNKGKSKLKESSISADLGMF